MRQAYRVTLSVLVLFALLASTGYAVPSRRTSVVAEHIQALTAPDLHAIDSGVEAAVENSNNHESAELALENQGEHQEEGGEGEEEQPQHQQESGVGGNGAESVSEEAVSSEETVDAGTPSDAESGEFESQDNEDDETHTEHGLEHSQRFAHQFGNNADADEKMIATSNANSAAELFQDHLSEVSDSLAEQIRDQEEEMTESEDTLELEHGREEEAKLADSVADEIRQREEAEAQDRGEPLRDDADPVDGEPEGAEATDDAALAEDAADRQAHANTTAGAEGSEGSEPTSVDFGEASSEQPAASQRDEYFAFRASLDAQDQTSMGNFAAAPNMRLMRHSPCKACTFLVKHIAEEAARLRWNTNDIVAGTQTLCAQYQLNIPLKFECAVFQDTHDFLVKGEFLVSGGKKKANFTDFYFHPGKFCRNLDLCGATPLSLRNISSDVDFIPRKGAVAQGAVIFRTLLYSNVSSIPRASSKWPVLVKSLLSDVATLLRIDRNRLVFHHAPTDDLAEIIIKPHPRSQRKNHKAPRTPRNLARLLRAILSSKNAPPSAARDRLLSNINVYLWRPQIAPLVVHPTIPRRRIRDPRHTNGTHLPCPILLRKSRKHCGDSFKCHAKCRKFFGQYFTFCLAKSLPSHQYRRTKRQYKSFFTACDECTQARVTRTKRQCGFTPVMSLEQDLPANCSLHCSNAYLPYYSKCLAYAAEEWPQTKRTLLTRFVDQCQQCTPQRERDVKEICDTRQEIRSPFPATCTLSCSSHFLSFYGSCLLGDSRGVSKKATEFKEQCRVASEGGVFARLKMKIGITQVKNMVDYKLQVAQELATVAHCDAKRVEVTLVEPLNPPKNSADDPVTLLSGMPPAANPEKQKQQASEGGLLVDFVLLNSDNVDDVNPLTLIENLRSAVNNPASALFRLKHLQHIDASFNFRTLVANTHSEDTQRTPSPLHIARSELRKAKEEHKSLETINLLKAVVSYHQLLVNGTLKDKPKLNALKAAVNFYSAVSQKLPRARISALHAKYQLKKAIAEQMATTVINALKARVRYLMSIANEAPKAVIESNLAILAWRHAQQMAKPPKEIDRLNAIAAYKADIAARAPQTRLNADKAFVHWKTKVAQEEHVFNITLAKAVWRYMVAIDRGEAPESIKAREAIATYRRAVALSEPRCRINEKEAIMTYMKAVESKSAQDLLTDLSKKVLELHDLCEKLMQQVYDDRDALVRRRVFRPTFNGQLKRNKDLVITRRWQKAFTWTFWLKPNSTAKDFTSILHKGSNNFERNIMVAFYPDSTRLHIRSGTDRHPTSFTPGSSVGCDPDDLLGLGYWQFVAITHLEGLLSVWYGDASIYGNFRLVCSKVLPAPVPNDGPLYAGSPFYKAADTAVADLRIFNRILSKQELSRIRGAKLGIDSSAEDLTSTVILAPVQPKSNLLFAEARQLQTYNFSRNEFTYSFWMKIDKTSSNPTGFLNKGGPSVVHRNPGVFVMPKSTELFIASGTTLGNTGKTAGWNDHCQFSERLALKTWTFVAVTHKAGNLTVFIGDASATPKLRLVCTATLKAPVENYEPLFGTVGSSVPHGKIADLRVFNRVLPRTQIRSICGERRGITFPNTTVTIAASVRVHSTSLAFGNVLAQSRELTTRDWFGSYTYTFWIKLQNSSNDLTNVLHKGAQNYERNPAFFIDGPTSKLVVKSGTLAKPAGFLPHTDDGVPVNYKFPLNQWVFVAMHHKQGHAEVYVGTKDGNFVSVGSNSKIGAPVTNNGPLLASNGYVPPAQAKVADVRVYNDYLSEKEIQVIFRDHRINNE